MTAPITVHNLFDDSFIGTRRELIFGDIEFSYPEVASISGHLTSEALKRYSHENIEIIKKNIALPAQLKNKQQNSANGAFFIAIGAFI